MNNGIEQCTTIENVKQECIDELSDRKIIKISNNMCSAKFKIKETSLNILMILLSEIKMEDKELKTYDISLLSIEKKLNKKFGRVQKRFDTLCNDLTGTNLCLADSTEFIALCSLFELVKEEGAWFIKIKINPVLQDELLNLQEQFTTINIEQFLQLNGLYTKRVYMLMCQVSGLPFWKKQVEDIYTVLMLSDSYRRYDNFKSRVLNASINQINALPNKEIEVSYSEDKRGSRKVKQLTFKVQKTEERKKKAERRGMTPKERKKQENNEKWGKAISGEMFNDEDTSSIIEDDPLYKQFVGNDNNMQG
jgi:plasmid replication initiation protein